MATAPQTALDFSSLLVSDIEIADADRAVELIVVPAARPQHNLAYAIRLAKESGAQLVVLASHDAQAAAAAASIARAGARGFVVELPREYALPLSADFVTNRHAFANHTSNLSDKRNIGLLLSKLTSMNVFFLDDDIRGLSTRQLNQAEGMLRNGYSVAGFLVDNYPDNSVACHANRLSGGTQGAFISGGVQAIASTFAESAFSPKIYNEDWLFMHDAVANRQAIVSGTISQLPYDPFRDPARAMSEEFGDVLAEGLYDLLTAGNSFREAGGDYWRFALARRKNFISDIAERLTASLSAGDERVPQALISLNAAKLQLEKFAPHDFADYVQAWRDDIGRWQDRVGKLPKGLSLGEAITFLDLPVVTVGLDKMRQSLVQLNR